MNNIRGNNRRRGRGGGRQQGGGHQINRIDSRARGNATQLLEKYRKLALDAHLNGDRVTEEYYLQFADHYFRVIADTRQRQDEGRPRRDERWQEGGDSDREEADDGTEFAEADGSPYDQAPVYNNRRNREDRPRREEREPRPESRYEPRVEPRPEPRSDEEARGEGKSEDMGEDVGEVRGEQPSVYEPVENPFLRENRSSSRGLRPRREDRRPRREHAEQDQGGQEHGEPEPVGLDPASLPPSISASREEAVAAPEEAEAKPRRRTRRPRPAADEALEPVSHEQP